MKHPEGRITARTRSDRLLGCSSTSTGAGDAGRNTPTRVDDRRKQAQHARLRPEATQYGGDGGLTNHSVRGLSHVIREAAWIKLKRGTEPVKAKIHVPCPRRLLVRQEPMVRLAIVAALLGRLLLGDPLSHGAQLCIGLRAGAGQVPECPPHPAGVHLRQIEMRLFVAQDAPALRAVVQHDRLEPGLARTESGDHPKFEYITSAFPDGV